MEDVIKRILGTFGCLVACEYANLLTDPQQRIEALNFLMSECIVNEGDYENLIAVVQLVREYRDLTADEMVNLIRFRKAVGMSGEAFDEVAVSLGEEWRESELLDFRKKVIDIGSWYYAQTVENVSGIKLTIPELNILLKKCMDKFSTNDVRAIASSLRARRTKHEKD